VTAVTQLIRAAITPEEWAQIRKLAIDRDVPATELVGQTLRRHLLAGKRAGGSRVRP
jgi:hypothetical protein